MSLRPHENDSPVERRLMRLAQQCVSGDIAGAELELHEWVRHDDCPATALALLAALLARRGRREQALDVLHHRQRLEADNDLSVGCLLTAVLIELDLTEAARRSALQVHHDHGHDAVVHEWLAAIEPRGLPQLPSASVERLAVELAARPQVIPSLVAAAKAKPDPNRISLLRQALARAAREFTEDRQMLMVCQAVAELSLLAGDSDDARRWAHRGLKVSPYSAPLALVLGQIADDAAVGPPAVDVLRLASEAHPAYPDLRAALDRRLEQAA